VLDTTDALAEGRTRDEVASVSGEIGYEEKQLEEVDGI